MATGDDSDGLIQDVDGSVSLWRPRKPSVGVDLSGHFASEESFPGDRLVPQLSIHSLEVLEQWRCSSDNGTKISPGLLKRPFGTSFFCDTVSVPPTTAGYGTQKQAPSPLPDIQE